MLGCGILLVVVVDGREQRTSKNSVIEKSNTKIGHTVIHVQ